jgi:flagellum-specific ATP synthase
MLARGAMADVVVIALVGERGRELREFIEDDLGPEGLARSVVICATSDQSAMLRRDAALAGMTVAEHFRDRGLSVLLLMDSMTRYAQALRDIGLAAGELPARAGYPPSVFAALPRLLERAGPGVEGQGEVTAFFTVLTEGDEAQDPVAEATRGILDGHVHLDRRVADSGRYPAVDALRSLSRTMPGVLEPDERPVSAEARRLLALWQDLADLVRVGAWKPGSDAETDRAVRLAPRIEALLAQGRDEMAEPRAAFAALREVLADAA